MVAALRRQVDVLAAQVEASRTSRRSMRAEVRCPSCGGRRIYRANRVVDQDSGGSRPMSIAVKGLFFPKAQGVFGCDVCAACGLVGWHIDDPSTIDPSHEDVELIVAEEDAVGPYR